MQITPWEIKGKVDYEKLIKEFGVQKIESDLLKKMEEAFKDLHVTLKRNYFYAHREFDKWLNSFLEGKTVSIVTGRGPSNFMHIGHIVVFYFVKWLQEKTGAYLFIPFSDDEKYLVKNKSFKEIREYTINNLINILAIGFDKKRTKIFIDTEEPIIYSLAIHFSKYLNFNTIKAVFGEDFKNIGWLFYPAVQVAHILLPQVLLGPHETVVPVGIDQDPYLRVSRDLAVKYKFLKPKTILSKFFPSLEDPFGKMSSSKEKLISLDDSFEDIKRKIKKYAFSGGRPTIEEHKKYGGNPDIDVSFLYLYYFFEEDDKKIEELRENYKKGELLTKDLKNYATEKIWEFLKEFQKKKKLLRKVGKKNLKNIN
jgi:tryptophanyl-tRNA synthetase